MANQCIALQEFEKLLNAQSDDPGFQHLKECPRCRADFAAYRSFMEGNSDLGDQLREDQLAAVLRQTVLGQEQSAENGFVLLKKKKQGISKSMTRNLLALAAVLAVFFSFNYFQTPAGDPVVHLRGNSDPATSLLNPQTLSLGEGIQISWSPIEGADHYQVEILSTGFKVLEKMDISSVTQVAITLEQQNLWKKSSPTLLWRVVALQGRQVIVQSPARALRTKP